MRRMKQAMNRNEMIHDSEIRELTSFIRFLLSDVYSDLSNQIFQASIQLSCSENRECHSMLF